MRPSPCRQVQPSLRALASSSGTKSSSKPLVRRTDELAKRLDIAKIAPHAWNDVPSPAHLQLEAERERRHFARLVALDLPQLKEFSNQFKPPSKQNAALQLRMQSYIGETHPAHHSLVLSSQISALPLNSDTARHKFRVLAGPHWDAKDDSFKLSVNRFTTREENAKWASQTLDRLLSAANDPKDTMSDIPADTRPSRAKSARRAKRLGKVSIADYPTQWITDAKTARDAQAKLEAPSST